MCDVFFCFSNDPVPAEEYRDDDPRRDFLSFSRTWQVAMKDAPMQNPGWCLYGAFCEPCAQYQIRKMAINQDMSQYSCCQNLIKIPCAPDNLGQGNECCLCLEVCCCGSCAVSASRMYIQQQKQIVSDPCDNKIIRFNNAIQMLSCLCNIAAALTENEALDDAADILDLIASLVYCITSGCMAAQMQFELTHEDGAAIQMGAPEVEDMER